MTTTTGPLALLVLFAALLGAAGLWVVFYGPWQRQCIDVARRELFVARDELFLLFALSDLGVDHPSHRRLRQVFNRMIRYAHRITWLRVMLYIVVLSPRLGLDHTAMAVRALGDDPIVGEALDCVQRGQRALIRSMVRRSLLLLVLMTLRSVARGLGLSMKKAQQQALQAAESIIVVAEREEETAASTRPRRADATV